MIVLKIKTQPDDETCGPTCLQAIYNYYGLKIKLADVIQGVERSLSGGTLAPMLGKHALMHGFKVSIYINNVDLFDPTWFIKGESHPEELIAKLDIQMKHKSIQNIIEPSIAYQQYLSLGGKVLFQTISVQLIKKFFKQKIPILTGLSATYLYPTSRERFSRAGGSIFDDIRGTPCGHFVILCGYDSKKRHLVIADPIRQNPLSHNHYYKVGSNRLINAIMLGVLTYDANLLIIQPKNQLN